METIAELKKIKEALEVLINESERPNYTIGKHYIARIKNSDARYIINLDRINKNSHDAKYYMIHNSFISGGTFDYIECEATPSEVQEALEKEAVKNGLIKGARIKHEDGTICTIGNEKHYLVHDKSKFYFITDNKLYAYAEPKNICLMNENGAWATPIKTKTIDDLASEFEAYVFTSKSELSADFRNFCIKEKQTIIETLNNL